VSALTEKVAREHLHWSGLGECRCGAPIPEVGCGDNRDLYAEHVAEVAEAETRAAVAAEIRAEADTFMRVTLATYEDLPVRAYLKAARIAEGKQP